MKRLLTQKEGGMCSTFREMAWDRIEPYWLVCEQDGVVVGCIQCIPSLPIAHIDFLVVDREALGVKGRAMAVKRLVMTAVGLAVKAGATLTMTTVPFVMKEWKKVLKRRGAVVATQGNILVKRIGV